MSGTLSSDPRFDLSNPSITRVIQQKDPVNRYPDEPEGEEQSTANPLDDEVSQGLHKNLMENFQQEAERQRTNRQEMATDEDFYDGIQLTEEELRVMSERGQAPTVLNVISQTINWITGTERRGRSDYDVLPRRENGEKAAKLKTDILKYLSDVTDSNFKRSRSFKDAVVAGVGWSEDCLADLADDEVLTTRYVPWREMLWDSASYDLSLKDARYLFRQKWVDVDTAKVRYPGRDAVILSSVGEGFSAGEYAFGDEVADQMEEDRTSSIAPTSVRSNRPRLRIIEAWYRTPENVDVIRGGQFHGEIFDPNYPGHVASIEGEGAYVTTAMVMRMNIAIFVSKGLLFKGPSPYRHNDYPYTPIWCFRYGRNQLPYSIVRGLRNMQSDINKRFSKSLHILSTNKTIIENGAVADLDEFLEEVNRPDGVIVVKDDALSGNRIKFEVGKDLAPAHLDLMMREIGLIQQVGGVTDEMMGRTTNAKSGVAIQARQSQGMMSTAEVFDNLRLSYKLQGEKQLSLVEQYITDEKQFRITGDRGRPQYVSVNDGSAENDITKSKADFIIGESDWRLSMRQAQADAMFDLISKLPPQAQLLVLDLAVEQLDLPNVQEIVKRIRAMTGAEDPDNKENPEQQAQRAQMAAQQQQMETQKALLELRALTAKVSRDEAETARVNALIGQISAQTDLQAASLIKLRADTVGAAIVAGADALTPGVPVVADAVLKEIGFVAGSVPSTMDVAMQRAQQENGGTPMTPGGNAQPPVQQQEQQAQPGLGRVIPPADAQPQGGGQEANLGPVIRPADAAPLGLATNDVRQAQ